MQRPLVPAYTSSCAPCFVLKTSLSHLIREKKIHNVLQSDRLEIKEDRRGIGKDEYNGRERRFDRIVDWRCFLLSMDQQLRNGSSLEAVLGFGEKGQKIAQKLRSVAKTGLSVLIQGKTGTGKGVAALILHELSRRRGHPFIRVDCGAIPPTLIESELFGYEKGSFTGAFKSKPGRFQLANEGTIFLDEIANLSLDMQTRLLGFLEERVVNSIGGTKSVKIDVRIISATNANLQDQIKRCQFREDLFYRLNEFDVEMPSLKDRTDDLFYLAAKFLAMANIELEKDVFGFSEAALDFITENEWSGNIRELKNVIKRAALTAGDVIEVEDLLERGGETQPCSSLDAWLENAFIKGKSLREIISTVARIAEKRFIEKVYENSNNNKARTSQHLGIDYSTLFRKMAQYRIGNFDLEAHPH
jgi:transcriptional regulator with PAS, ATPase and Fis domain